MTPPPMQFIAIALAVVLAMVAGTLRVLWWFWTEHEQAQVRERMRQRANGGGVVNNSWARYQEARRERR
jgi:hypothetical protein